MPYTILFVFRRCCLSLLKKRKQIDDSCEVYLNDEFLGLIYKESEEGEDEFQFHMSILKEDLKK